MTLLAYFNAPFLVMRTVLDFALMRLLTYLTAGPDVPLMIAHQVSDILTPQSLPKRSMISQANQHPNSLTFKHIAKYGRSYP